MDLNYNLGGLSKSTPKLMTPIREFKVQDFKIPGPVGCLACTSGDSPIFDFEQQFLGGY